MFDALKKIELKETFRIQVIYILEYACLWWGNEIQLSLEKVVFLQRHLERGES